MPPTSASFFGACACGDAVVRRARTHPIAAAAIDLMPIDTMDLRLRVKAMKHLSYRERNACDPRRALYVRAAGKFAQRSAFDKF